MPSKTKIIRPHFSILALLSFVASFIFARVFTTLKPDAVLISGNFHIHHFWYGLALLSIGGWLGISYNDEGVDRLAAILFGAGGGLIGDEIGLLITFGDYWTGLTYTMIIVFLTFVSIIILFVDFSRTIGSELDRFLGYKPVIYFGILLATISLAFIIQAEDLVTITISSISLASACLMIFGSLILLKRKKP